MPNKHYSSKPTSLRYHLMAKSCCLKVAKQAGSLRYHLMAKRCMRVGRKAKSEARNLPTWGCKSMMEGPTIMLGVFITLLYT